MNYDAELVAKVAEALNDEGAAPGSSIHSWRCEHPDRYGPCTCVDETARVVLDALDVPSLIRAAKAEALTQAARDIDLDLGVGYTMPDDAAATREAEAWLIARAAKIDPEEADDE